MYRLPCPAVEQRAVWVNDKGYILNCCPHTPEVFGYWRVELKG
jgi:hypothetical protein